MQTLASTNEIPWLNSSFTNYVNNNYGKPFCRVAWSDIFFVPKRLAAKFQTLSSIFYKNKVFLEIAVPNIFTFLDSMSNFESAFGFYLPDKYGSIDFSDGKIVWEEYNYDLYFIHPFKLHGNSNRFSEIIFKICVQEYCDKLNQCH